MNKIVASVVGDVISEFVQSHVPQMTAAVVETTEELGAPQTTLTVGQVQKIAVGMTTQDTPLRSKRVWAFALPVVSTLGYALLDPSLIGAFVGWLQAHPGAWWGVAANIVAVTLPIISKALDQRPTR